MSSRWILFAAVALGAAASLMAQDNVPRPAGLVPEQMWYAPTAADWQKPVQIRWQRTWDDAVRLSQATRQPILVCVNMDGEIASEHYAGVRYRDPEIGKLYAPYVCVIASVYRHNERDYDNQGHRILCPRFGTVTCGEHIAMESIVYEKFLDGKRISPRHIMVELDGSKVYDVFHTWDTASVFQTIRNGIDQRTTQSQPIVKGDRSLREKLESPDSADRDAIEQLFTADATQRRALLDTALATGAQVPIELLRLATFGLDPDLAKKARAGMLQAEDPGTVDLIADTLRVPMAADERKTLAESLRRFADKSTRAQTLATAFQGLASDQAAIDTARWRDVMLSQDYAAAAAPQDRSAEAERRDEKLAAKPDDPEARLDVAETSLLQAFEVEPSGNRGALRQAAQQRELLLDDAAQGVELAAKAGAKGWRVDALRALIARQQGRRDEAYELAVKAAPALPTDAPGRVAMELLTLFAEARQEAIAAAVRAHKPWPPSWSTDVNAAYSVLDVHPLGRDTHVANHYDFLDFFGSPDADAVLDRGLTRFPASAALHQRLRQRALKRGGERELEAEYERRLQVADAPATLRWFAGYASMVAAEAHRRRADGDAAIAAYQRAIASFARYRVATGNSDGDHYVAVAHGGIARVHLQAGDLAGTFDELQQTFTIAPAAAAAVDGLGMTAMQTAEMLRASATEAKDDALVQRLDAALKQLPPEAFDLPEYERAERGQRRGNRGGR